MRDLAHIIALALLVFATHAHAGTIAANYPIDGPCDVPFPTYARYAAMVDSGSDPAQLYPLALERREALCGDVDAPILAWAAGEPEVIVPGESVGWWPAPLIIGGSDDDNWLPVVYTPIWEDKQVSDDPFRPPVVINPLMPPEPAPLPASVWLMIFATAALAAMRRRA